MAFYNENKHLYTDTSPYGIMLTTFQAATQASQSEINSLKEQVKELQSHLSSQSIEIAHNHVTLESYAHKVTELQAHVNQLREALVVCKEYITEVIIDDRYHEATCSLDDLYLLRDKAINLYKLTVNATPEQSLAEHDNEVIERCAKVCDEYLNTDYPECASDIKDAIIALKVTP